MICRQVARVAWRVGATRGNFTKFPGGLEFHEFMRGVINPLCVLSVAAERGVNASFNTTVAYDTSHSPELTSAKTSATFRFRDQQRQAGAEYLSEQQTSEGRVGRGGSGNEGLDEGGEEYGSRNYLQLLLVLPCLRTPFFKFLLRRALIRLSDRPSTYPPTLPPSCPHFPLPASAWYIT